MKLPPSLPAHLSTSRRIPELELSLIQKLASGRAALPMLPAVASKALELANDPDASVGAFAALIETDPPIAARFLATANSALYSRGHEVRTVVEAVGRIGLAGARDLVLQVVYASGLGQLKLYKPIVQRSFERSVKVGILCRIADRVLSLGVDDAYLCGLLHDIGESRVCRILNEFPKAADEEVARLVGRYHTRAGAELAERWTLPTEIVDVCRCHEEPWKGEGAAVLLVRLSNALLDATEQQEIGAPLTLPEAVLEELHVASSDAHLVVERAARALAA